MKSIAWAIIVAAIIMAPKTQDDDVAKLMAVGFVLATIGFLASLCF